MAFRSSSAAPRELRKILGSIPSRCKPTKGTSFLVTLFKARIAAFPAKLPVTIPKSSAVILSLTGSEAFSETHGGGEGALPNGFLESALGTKCTTRSLNVVRELVDRCDRLEGSAVNAP